MRYGVCFVRSEDTADMRMPVSTKPLREPRLSRARAAGFTLVELMVVVVIISIGLIVFQPSFSLAMAQRRAGLLARELVRLGRVAQSEAVGTQRATVLWFGNDQIRLVRGRTSSCVENTTWSTQWAACSAGASVLLRPMCVEQLSLANSQFQRAPFELRIAAVASTLPSASDVPLRVSLCYAPSGAVYSAVNDGVTMGAAAFSGESMYSLDGSQQMVAGAGSAGAVAGGSGLLVRVRTVDVTDNSTVGALRHVLFPKGTTPRVVQ